MATLAHMAAAGRTSAGRTAGMGCLAHHGVGAREARVMAEFRGRNDTLPCLVENRPVLLVDTSRSMTQHAHRDGLQSVSVTPRDSCATWHFLIPSALTWTRRRCTVSTRTVRPMISALQSPGAVPRNSSTHQAKEIKSCHFPQLSQAAMRTLCDSHTVRTPCRTSGCPQIQHHEIERWAVAQSVCCAGQYLPSQTGRAAAVDESSFPPSVQ
jgi:hypothetical protein